MDMQGQEACRILNKNDEKRKYLCHIMTKILRLQSEEIILNAPKNANLHITGNPSELYYISQQKL
jgi:hypothetical protein